MLRRSLRCSFCRRREQDVDKLVAGPRVFICDRCVAIAVELMKTPADPDQAASARPGFMRRAADRVWRLVGARQTDVGMKEAASW
jgi:ATP-dependent Clp protease ATP-binding subunit ClpX